MRKELYLGMDIGTTTISAVVIDGCDGALVASRTVKSEADIPASNVWEKLQDAHLIEAKVRELLNELIWAYPEVVCIGITGQMHGIVYLDENGRLLSPLYTWQDRRAEFDGEAVLHRSDYPLYPGYGLATHYTLVQTGMVPEGAVKICTIMDYLAFSLSGKLKMHSSNAASLGFYSLREGCFDESALQDAGIRADILPEVTVGCEILGTYRRIPVAVAIGDNQASFLGSVADPKTMALANFGTGSQISVMWPHYPGFSADGSVEVRPLLGSSCLICGSALCGGRAYALLEQFFRSFLVAAGGEDREVYSVLNKLAQENYGRDGVLYVTTTFSGTRSDPTVRGSICGIGEENFNPAALTTGVLMGMARELWEMFDQMLHTDISQLVASGNAVRRNPALVKAVRNVFHLPVRIPAHQEEAAFGAALFGAAAAGYERLEKLQQRCIRYQGESSSPTSAC